MAPAIGAIVLCYYLWTNINYIHFLGQPTKNVYWTPAIYDLFTYTESVGKPFVSIDWGTHTQLLGLSQNARKYKEMSLFLNNRMLPKESREEFTRKYLYGDRYRFILHNEKNTLYQIARKNFFDLAYEHGFEPKVEKRLKSGEQVIFEVYRLEPFSGIPAGKPVR